MTSRTAVTVTRMQPQAGPGAPPLRIQTLVPLARIANVEESVIGYYPVGQFAQSMMKVSQLTYVNGDRIFITESVAEVAALMNGAEYVEHHDDADDAAVDSYYNDLGVGK